MNIGFPIDWAATGSMVSGVAAFASAGAIAFGAWFGAKQWREQKLLENKIDVAQRVIRSAYRLEDSLDYILSPVLNQEDVAQYGIESSDSIPFVADQDPMLVGTIIIDRLSHCQDDIIDFRRERIDAKLFFGMAGWTAAQEFYAVTIQIRGIGFSLKRGIDWPGDDDPIGRLFSSKDGDGYLSESRRKLAALENAFLPLLD
ncbi:MAG: hypothetical protein AAFQ27_03255 [Pseudomonadota bacterium]